MEELRYISACRHGEWHLQLHPEGEPSKARPYRYRCRSWRHEGECCECKAAEDYCRIKEAVAKGENWVLVVLTFDQSKWGDWMEQYKLSCPLWSILRCRLLRSYGKIPYIQTWERHKSKGIHVNVLIDNKLLAEDCYHHYDHRDKEWRWSNDLLQWDAVASGFGYIHWAEPLRSGTGEKMASYLVKTAQELVGAGRKGQIPYDAPKHFRRLRASRRLLPAKQKSGLTGGLKMWPFPDWLQSDIDWIDKNTRDDGEIIGDLEDMSDPATGRIHPT